MKKIILTAISSFITLSVLALDSGRCGENVTWVFDEATETLTISGSGKMHDYSPNDGIEAPWKRYAYSTFSYSIKKIYIKDGVTSIGSYAFTTCKNLISIEIPNSVTSIGEGAFWGCTELTTFVIPNSVTNIGQKAFYGTQWYKNQGKLIYAGNVFYEDHTGNQVRELKAGTTGIADGAFSTNSALTSVTIPNSVKSIGKKAFEGCSNLPSIVIPRSVTSIGEYAFSGCTSLASINIPSGVTSIENGTFYDCSGLTSVGIPYGITSIGDYTFFSCTNLTSVQIPKSIISIGESAFCNCRKLTAIVIPYNVTTIRRETFRSCKGLASIVIPNSVTSIGDLSFNGCTSLTSIGLPNSVTSIGASAFEYCTGLNSIEIPNSVTSIGYDAFSNTEWYKNQSNGLVYAGNIIYKYKGVMPANTSIQLKDSTTGIAGCAFSGCTCLTSIIIPNSVTSIGFRAFYGCTGLDSIEIPNSVISIGECAFEDCSGLNSIEIPNSVISIGEWAFEDCTNLASIKFSNSITDISIGTFHGCTGIKDFYCFSIECPSTEKNALYGVFSNSSINIATLHVPELAIETYGSTEPWSNFGTIVALPKFRLEYYVDGLLYKSYEIEEGVNIKDYEKKPDKEGYSFSGWMGLPETMPAHDVTVTGTFIINKYKLIYQVDGTDYKTYEVEYGASITTEPAPTKEGYTFSGWSEIPETMPAHDVTVTGTFILDTGINHIMNNENGDAMIFTIDGKRVNKLQKNLNIIRMKDGTTRKVIKK